MKKRHEKKPSLSQSDQRLFNDAMQGVKPLKQGTHTLPYRKPINATATTFDEDEIVELREHRLSDARGHQFVSSDDIINYCTSCVSSRVYKKLCTGKVPIKAHLDLHGSTIEQARQQVGDFILESHELNKKCVIIIHGKGSMVGPPKLKSMVNQWLQQIPYVLAFCSTQNHHGGRGSVYVLIRTRKLTL